jgi:hypothetical protein
MKNSDYFEEFHNAIVNSNSLFKLNIEFKYQNKIYNTEDNLQNFQTKISKYAQDKNIYYEQIVGNCSPYHHYMKDVIEKLYNCKCYLTIGYITMSSKEYFKFNLEDIEKSISNKNLLTSHHAWLTLDNYEILDMVFSTSYGFINNEKEMIGQVIQQHPNDLKGLKYHPILVGDDFFKECGFDLDIASSFMYP